MVPTLALVSLCALGCSSSGSSSGAGEIQGEWSTPGAAGAGTDKWFFNADGTCGLVVMENNTSLCSTTGCSYTFAGSTLSLTTSTTAGGVTQSTTYTETVVFSNGGSTATVTATCDAGKCFSTVSTYTRVNSNAQTSCP